MPEILFSFLIYKSFHLSHEIIKILAYLYAINWLNTSPEAKIHVIVTFLCFRLGVLFQNFVNCLQNLDKEINLQQYFIHIQTYWGNYWRLNFLSYIHRYFQTVVLVIDFCCCCWRCSRSISRMLLLGNAATNKYKIIANAFFERKEKNSLSLFRVLQC